MTQTLKKMWSALMRLLALGALVCCGSVTASRAPTKISPEIVRELKEFTHLIPKAVIEEIVAKYFFVDSNFREAVKYLSSPQFDQLVERAQQVPEIFEILTYLHVLAEADADTGADADASEVYRCQPPCPRESAHDRAAAVAGLPPPELDLEIVLLNTVQAQPMDDRQPLMPPHATDLRSFNSFVEELMDQLPRGDYVQMINRKRQKSAVFAQFYAALRSAQLRSMVNVALKAPNVIEVLKPLGANGVDVKNLKETAFKVISWGPAV